MRHIIVIALLIFGLIGALRTTNPYMGEDLIIFTKFLNPEGRKISGVDFRIYSLDSEDLIVARSLDLRSGRNNRVVAFYDTSSLEPGEHVIRIVTNHKRFGRQVRHAVFVIG